MGFVRNCYVLLVINKIEIIPKIQNKQSYLCVKQKMQLDTWGWKQDEGLVQNYCNYLILYKALQ